MSRQVAANAGIRTRGTDGSASGGAGRDALRVGFGLALAVMVCGCGFDAKWPQSQREYRPGGAEMLAYRVDGAKKPNYFQKIVDGRVVELCFDSNGDGGCDETVDRRQDSAEWPHCILVLDGAAYEVMDELWREGHFRLFPPPTRMISVFPSLTDLAMTQIFQTPICEGPEALYFDAAANKMRGGISSYLKGENAPWLSYMTYHAPQDIGAWAYLTPQSVFDREMRGTLKTFVEAKTGTVTAYSVGASGLGTDHGKEAIRKYLLTVEQLCERVIYDKRGRVKLTLTSDHGHSLQECKRVNFEQTLKKAGYRDAERIDGPNDVVAPAYGLVTYSSLFAKDVPKLARTMLDDEAVDLSTYADGERVVVLSREGEAAITKGGAGYRYAASQGDPLKLLPIVEQLRGAGKVAADGTIDDRALFDATTTHDYPDPLHRLWKCYHDLMKCPPQAAVSLKPNRCHGSWMFEIGIGKCASTHGSLDLPNSSAFVLSDIGELPKTIRIDDFQRVITAAREAALRRQSETRAAMR